MGLSYNVTDDFLYRQGIEKGLEEGIEKGQQEMQRKMIVKMLKAKVMSMAEIADLAEVPLAYVQQIARELTA